MICWTAAIAWRMFFRWLWFSCMLTLNTPPGVSLECIDLVFFSAASIPCARLRTLAIRSFSTRRPAHCMCRPHTNLSLRALSRKAPNPQCVYSQLTEFCDILWNGFVWTLVPVFENEIALPLQWVLGFLRMSLQVSLEFGRRHQETPGSALQILRTDAVQNHCYLFVLRNTVCRGSFQVGF